MFEGKFKKRPSSLRTCFARDRTWSQPWKDARFYGYTGGFAEIQSPFGDTFRNSGEFQAKDGSRESIVYDLILQDPVYLSAWMTSLLFFASRARLVLWLPRWCRLRWALDIAGIASLCVHIVSAYWLAHDWSHDAAIEHVAQRTYDLIGIRSGLGIYANFFVVIAWTVLALAERRKLQGSRPCKEECWGNARLGLEIFLWLMFISASIVFAKPISAAVFSMIALASAATGWISRRHDVGGRENGSGQPMP